MLVLASKDAARKSRPLAVFGEGDGVYGEFVVAGVFVTSDEEGGDLGDDELLVDELECGESDGDDEDGFDDSVETDSRGHECDEFAASWTSGRR